MTSTAARELSHGAAAGAAVQRARRLLLACQRAEGWWPDPAAAAISVAAEGLLALDVMAVRSGPVTHIAARRIRAAQRADGSWAGGEPGPAADLSASVLAYLALRLAGDSPDAYHMATAAGWIRDAGGVHAVSVPARVWLAMFGLADWASVPVPAPEVSSLSARATPESEMRSPVATVTLAVLGALRPTRPPPATLTELQATGPPRRAGAGPCAARAARPAALRRCGRWLADWQLQSGPAEPHRPGWPLTLVALHALGYPASDPAQVTGLAQRAAADEPPGWRSEGLAPVANTALAIEALSAAGSSADRAALLAAGRWLLGQQLPAPAPALTPRDAALSRGWSFCPDGCPRPADTACVLAALGVLDPQFAPGLAAPDGAVRWLAETQGRDGSWAGSAALTGYCVRALASQPARQPPTVRAVRRGVIWLLRNQLPLGAWPGGRGDGDLLATTVALTALRAAGVLPGKPSVTGAVSWLLAAQHTDGGWYLGGIAGASLAGASLAGAGLDGASVDGAGSDPVGTAQALTALVAAGAEARPAVDAAARWLISAQLPDGSWDYPGPGAAADRQLRWRPASAASPAAGVLLPLRALGSYAATVS